MKGLKKLLMLLAGLCIGTAAIAMTGCDNFSFTSNTSGGIVITPNGSEESGSDEHSEKDSMSSEELLSGDDSSGDDTSSVDSSKDSEDTPPDVERPEQVHNYTDSYSGSGICHNCNAMVKHEHAVYHWYDYETACQSQYLMHVRCETCDYAVELLIQGSEEVHTYDEDGHCIYCGDIADWHVCEYDDYGFCLVCREVADWHVHEMEIDGLGYNSGNEFIKYHYCEDYLTWSSCAYCDYYEDYLIAGLGHEMNTYGTCNYCLEISDWHVHDLYENEYVYCEYSEIYTHCRYCLYREDARIDGVGRGHTYNDKGVCNDCGKTSEEHSCEYDEYGCCIECSGFADWHTCEWVVEAPDYGYINGDPCDGHYIEIECSFGCGQTKLYPQPHKAVDGVCWCGAVSDWHTCVMVSEDASCEDHSGKAHCTACFMIVDENGEIIVENGVHHGHDCEAEFWIELGHCYDENGICAECGKAAEWFNNKSE